MARTGKSRKHKEWWKVVSASEGKVSSSSNYMQHTLRWLLPLAVFCWPILYLFRHIFPINGQYTAVGNDFIGLYYKYKVYLLACLADFHFPLWSPAEGAGYPFYANPFAQAFYPFNLPLAVWYKISGGYNPLDHHVFTVLGLSIFALGLFRWLRLINSNLRAVVFAALVMSVSFKMTEILRFPNAVHAAAWYPWVLYALTKIMLSRSLRKAVLAGVLLTLFLICFCTAGYPYYVYYSLFLFTPYMLVFLIKPLRLRLLGVQAIRWKRAFGTLAVVGVVTLLICGPYLVGIKGLMSQTTDRTGKDFEYSTEHVFNAEDSLGSLVYPPAAQAEGWYFFSITGLLVVLLYMLSRRTTAGDSGEETADSKRETLIPPSPRDPWVKLFFIIWIGAISYISYGRHSYLFILLWKFMPGFSSLRVWGRLNIILVPILAWLLSVAYASFESVISGKDVAAVRRRSWVSSPIAVVIVAYAVVLGVQLYLYLNKIYDSQWLRYFENVSSSDIKFIIYGVAAFVTIFLLVFFVRRIRLRSNYLLTAVLAVLLFVAVLEMRPVGTHMWTKQRSPWKKRAHLDIAKINEASFRFRRTDHRKSISMGPKFSVGILEKWYFSRYIKFLKETEDELQERKILLGVHDGTKIFFSESIEHATVQSFLRDAMRYQRPGHLLSYTGDELNWEIQTPVAGYLSFIDNWDCGWKVCVDDEPAEIELLFGTFKSVQLAPGRHRVRFYYQPRILFPSKKGGL